MKLRDFRCALHDLVLLLPVVTVLCVAVGFFFRLPCGAGQWWLSVALVGAYVACRRPIRRSLAAFLAVAAILLLAWLGAAVYVNPSAISYDYEHYHLPAIRLLLAGWNPWVQSTPQMLSSAFALDPNGVSFWHILAMPHGEWYFDAAIAPFLGVGWNLLFACPFFVAVALLLTAWRVTESFPAGVRCLVVALAFAVIPGWIFFLMPHDVVLAMAAIGLLLSMWHTLRTGAWHWTELIGFSFWLCTAKQMSLFHCFLFWCAFGGTLLVRRFSWREGRRLLGAGALLCVLTAIVCASPYLSAWRDYGHPFYPVCTGDPVRHPAHNMTGDFLNRNADAARLGHAGMWLNAYVSATATSFGFRTCLGQDAFVPDVAAWQQLSDYPEHRGTPTSTADKLWFCLPLLILLVFGGVPERVLALAIAVTTAAMPSEYIGYARYVPWFGACGVFCVPVLWEAVHRRFPALKTRWVSLGLMLAAIAIAEPFVKPWAKAIDEAALVRTHAPREMGRRKHFKARAFFVTLPQLLARRVCEAVKGETP